MLKYRKKIKQLAFFLLITFLTNFSYGQKTVEIEWVNNLTGNFSFKNKWSYPEAVEKNEYGQLVCNGLCPEESYSMLDEKMKIKKEFLKAYYKIIDTTHQLHTIECDAWCYEWDGTDFIDVEKKSDTVKCITLGNMATHSSLVLSVINNSCYPTIELHSISERTGQHDDAIYKCTGGFIKIDKNLWKKRIMKAEFNFNFDHPENPEQPMFWKGKIYAKIENHKKN